MEQSSWNEGRARLFSFLSLDEGLPRMKLVIFGLTVTSSWGNGHATLWRGLIRALVSRGWDVTFFEKDMPYYGEHRDLTALPGGRLVLYRDLELVRGQAIAEIREADAAMVTSYCPDGEAASALVCEKARFSLFYDLDTPLTLARVSAGESVSYLPPEGLCGFDLVLSYTGGAALDKLVERLGAKRAAPLYGHVDPDAHRPVGPDERFQADLSYLGTYAADRQDKLTRLLIEPAGRRPDLRFLIGGACYPEAFPWRSNISFARHVPPPEHSAFFSSSRMTLNVTRRDMAALGWCPSGRLFEAAACGVPVLTDVWDGLECFFEPGREVITVAHAEEVEAAFERDDLASIGRAARERALDEHSSACRAAELERLLDVRAPLNNKAAVSA